MRFRFRHLLLLVFCVLKLAEIHYLSHRRRGGGGDFDEIKAELFRAPQSVAKRQDAKICAVVGNYPQFRSFDLMIYFYFRREQLTRALGAYLSIFYLTLQGWGFKEAYSTNYSVCRRSLGYKRGLSVRPTASKILTANDRRSHSSRVISSALWRSTANWRFRSEANWRFVLTMFASKL